jgi:mannose-1-phosphate guanylyltransferase
MSRGTFPKQFQALHGKDTMLQATVKRLDHLDVSSLVTICNDDHRFFVDEQLQEINRFNEMILEPVGRNTAPAITLAALTAVDDPILLVLAADHVIQEEDAFLKSINRANPLADAGKLITFGVTPMSAHTGYGYIKKGKRVDNGFIVDQFIEKPLLDKAEEFLSSGDHFWNSGMFMFRASVYLEEVQNFCPDVLSYCEASIEGLEVDSGFLKVDKQQFAQCSDISVDVAILEKTNNAVVVPMDAGWNDLGSWLSLWDLHEKDENENVGLGDVLLSDSKGCYVRAENGLLAVLGADDLVVVSTKDVILVANKDRVQDTKALVEQLTINSRKEVHSHPEVYRPWGKFDCLEAGDGYQVKRLSVKPGAKLSLQKHKYRAEHWVVVSGTAKVTKGDDVFILSENESTYIPLGAVHALENPGDKELHIIEVQIGTYLGEDDIIRYDDIYGRATVANKIV